MSDIQKLEKNLNALKNKGIATLLPQTSGWFSRKLVSMLVIAGVLVFLGRDQVASVIVALVWVSIGYLLSQCIPDAVREWQAGSVAKAKLKTDAMIKIAWIDAAANDKDGFDAEEKKAILEMLKD